MKRTAFSPHGELYINHIKSELKHDMPVQHYHDGYEIYLQLAGRRYAFYDNICHVLERGDMVILRPFYIHYAESRESDSYERYVINFHAKDLSVVLNDYETSYLLERLNSCVVRLDEEQTENLSGYFKRLEEFSKDKGVLAKKVLHSALIEFLSQVLNYIGKEQSTDCKKVVSNVSDAIEYINNNYHEDLCLNEICRAVNTSKYHLCHIFKDVTGATVMEYVNNVRLIKVHSMLIYTDSGIEEIAKETGFQTEVNLNRAFKKVYGVSPRTFRKKQQYLSDFYSITTI